MSEYQPGLATLKSVEGSRVLVVGALGAIGQGVVQTLRARGARVRGIDRVSGQDVVAADITRDEEVRAAVTQVLTELGGLDILINAAGIGPVQDAGAPPDESVRQTLEVNLLGPWRVVGNAMPALVESRGRIINVASGLAFATVPFAPAYAASKRAISAWSDALRMEYGSHVGITTIYPGYVKTPIHANASAAGLSLEGLAREEPLQAVVTTIVRACTGTPRRDLATTRMGAIELGLARHFPTLIDRVILNKMRQLQRQGRYKDAPLATDMLARWGMIKVDEGNQRSAKESTTASTID